MSEDTFKNMIDITPLVSEKTAVFPGDVPFSRQVALSFANKDHLELSSITSTLHIGAHTDAPKHYAADGKTIEERDLSYYLGPCQVVEVSIPRGERIKPEHLKVNITAKRVLFKTQSMPDPNIFNPDFNALSPELILKLKSIGVKLVGIDTPSVDLADSKDLPAHKAIHQADMAILEGIVLDKVAQGNYTLISLPLKLAGCDASPVRAILIKE